MGAITLHRNARTTPAIREEIRNRKDLSYRALAKEYGVSLCTIAKWKNRDDTGDRSHARHNLLSSLSAVEEEIVGELRTKVGLSIDDITEVMNRFINPGLTRSAIYRAMKRLKVTGSTVVKSGEVPGKFDEVRSPGFIHMDVKYLTKLDGKRSYLYVAIDRLTRYVFADILYDLEPSTSADFVKRFIDFFPHKVTKIITDNGFEWTDRCSGSVKEKATGNHPVDIVCAEHEIKHKLTRIRRPQTNGMVERFNRRVNEAIGQKAKIDTNGGKNSFHSHEERNAFVMQFVDNYNKTRLRCINYNAPIILLYNNHTKDNTKAGIQIHKKFAELR